MNRRMFASILGLGCLAAGQGGCAPAARQAEAKSDVPAPVTVTVAPIERRAIERTIEAVGSLRGWEQVTAGTKRPGRVLKVFHDMGDRVRPDEPLIQIDPVDARLAYSVAESRYLAELVRLGISSDAADDFVKRYGISETLVTGPQTEEVIEKVPAVVQYRVTMEKAAQNLARQRNLSRKGAGTAQELEDQESDYRSSVAAYDNAKSTARNAIAVALANRVSRDQSEQMLKDLTILAPHPQQPPPTKTRTDEVVYAIAARSVSEGQMIKEGEAVFDLVVENPLRLWANVPERYSDRIHEGQAVRISVASHPDRTFDGKVSRINPSVDPASRTFQVETVAPNEERLLRPGGFAKAVIVTDSAADASVVPIESIVQYAGVTKLFVLEGDVVRSVDDVVLLNEGSGWVEVESKSLPRSGMVVTTGQSKLAGGTKVVVREPEPEAAKKPAPAAAPTSAPKPAAEPPPAVK
ncbi:efflux RND transporter periplasmic adaptor subunit [Paludisphaera mucosa]|uniref:Efflux RND transporter periplasmic adaptor subunit n=1 Tax=Paludisphaera mucosa TaxID=3030827 RepID=A0ABT6FDS4_9BACT|nr:efflux RND transporter periplasmic adaptor subunit [Paludisphaera mucosa]MDG3005715.1 efflux RND transporter periplasmic adaptor subunit [Paludisphaera mucosa]